MAEYIDRDKFLTKVSGLIRLCEEEHNIGSLNTLYFITDFVNDCTIKGVDPIKHGKWILGVDDDNFDIKCSECGYQITFDTYSIKNVIEFAKEKFYCSNCGAKMDLKK